MANERIPVVGHLGMVPRHVTWTNYRAIGKTVAEAVLLYDEMKALENAGAYAAELEVVPHQLATFLCSETPMLLMSLGSGSGCDTQFLFSDDILGDYDERLPRHAKAYRDFNAEIQRLQTERIAAFGEYIAGGAWAEALAARARLAGQPVSQLDGYGTHPVADLISSGGHLGRPIIQPVTQVDR